MLVDADAMVAGREMDALVAEKVMGIAILGEARCAAPEGQWMVLSDTKDLDDTYGVVRSVYLDLCHCENLDKGDVELGIDNPHLVETICQNRKERRVFGHDVICLGVVREHSTSIAAAWEVRDKMERAETKIRRKFESHFVSIFDVTPLTICRAALEAKLT